MQGDYVEQINLLADICHDFPQVLAEEKKHKREKLALKALEWRWLATGEGGRKWIEETLAEAGVDVRSLIDVQKLDVERLQRLGGSEGE